MCVHGGGMIPGMTLVLNALTAFWATFWTALAQGWHALARFPWPQMGGVLYQRFRDARLGVSASSLTFTTVLALVPLLTVGLAVFSAFPMFGQFQDTIQRWLMDSLVPESISRQVIGALTQFSRKASRLGSVGLVAVLLSAVALMVTIERTLGQIWHVERRRPLAQRLVLYWSAITLGPLLLGAGLALSAAAAVATQEAGALPGAVVRTLSQGFEFALLVLAVSALYVYVPYTRVRWRHALAAGLLAGLGLGVGKKILASYLTNMPTYSAIYGAFAAVPIFLVWAYLAWVIVLLGAVVTASLPDMGRQRVRRNEGASWHFGLALEVLAHLHHARQTAQCGCSTAQLAQHLRVAPADLEPGLSHLLALDWAAPLKDDNAHRADQRWVLLVAPEQTLLAPLAQRMWLGQQQASAAAVWQAAQLNALMLADVLVPAQPSPSPSAQQP